MVPNTTPDNSRSGSSGSIESSSAFSSSGFLNTTEEPNWLSPATGGALSMSGLESLRESIFAVAAVADQAKPAAASAAAIAQARSGEP